MKQVVKQCRTARQAAAEQGRLYKQYNRVRLVSAPRFAEAGTLFGRSAGRPRGEEMKATNADTGHNRFLRFSGLTGDRDMPELVVDSATCRASSSGP